MNRLNCINTGLNKILPVLFFLFFPAPFFGQLSGPDSGKDQNCVLLINSYTELSAWSNRYITPVYKAIRRDNKLNVHTIHMNMYAMWNENDLEEFKKALFTEYKEHRVKGIILLGNTAWGLLGKDLREKWENVPVILCAEQQYTGPAEAYLTKRAVGENERIPLETAVKDGFLTVIHMPVYLRETLGLMLHMQPEINKILFLTDNRFISAQHRADLTRIIAENYPGIRLQNLNCENMSSEELTDTLEAADRQTGILYSSLYKRYRQGGHTIINGNMYRTLGNYTRQPVYTLDDIGVLDGGLMGGYFCNSEENIRVTLEIIEKALSGQKFNRVLTPLKPSPVFNYPTLLEKGFSEKSCPGNTFFYLRPQTLWTNYKYYILTVMAVVFLVIGILLSRIKMLSRIREEQKNNLDLMKNYNSLFNNMPIAYIKEKLLYGPSGEIEDYELVDVNRYFEKYFLPKEQVIGRKGSLLYNEDGTKAHMGYLRKCLHTGEPVLCQYHYVKSDTYYNIIIVPAETEGFVDIFCTETTELLKIQQELIRAKEKAEESNRLKSAFLANMSHEIRTPLNAIVGFSRLITEKDSDTEFSEYMRIIEQNTALLLQLIGDILDLSKIEAGTLEFIYKPTDLNLLLKELEQSVRLRIKGQPVEVFFEKGEPLTVRTERNRLLQVLNNLIANALKFTPRGSVRFGYMREKDFVRFYVADTGCGIPPDKLEYIFGRFVKLNDFTQGTGLGLSISRTIIEYMGGRIWAESAPGKGSVFYFTLPAGENNP